jgi:hypothetical protein
MNHLDELAAFEPTSFPFISLYLNMQADQHGRDNFESIVRKEVKAEAKSFPSESLRIEYGPRLANGAMSRFRRPLLG